MDSLSLLVRSGFAIATLFFRGCHSLLLSVNVIMLHSTERSHDARRRDAVRQVGGDQKAHESLKWNMSNGAVRRESG